MPSRALGVVRGYRWLGIQRTGEVAEHLVAARYMQLIASAHERAKTAIPSYAGLPVLAAVHDWGVLHETK